MNRQLYDEYKAEWTALAKTCGLDVVRIEAEDTTDYDGDPVTRILFIVDEQTSETEPVFQQMREFRLKLSEIFFKHFPDKDILARFEKDSQLNEAEAENQREEDEFGKVHAKGS